MRNEFCFRSIFLNTIRFHSLLRKKIHHKKKKKCKKYTTKENIQKNQVKERNITLEGIYVLMSLSLIQSRKKSLAL